MLKIQNQVSEITKSLGKIQYPLEISERFSKSSQKAKINFGNFVGHQKETSSKRLKQLTSCILFYKKEEEDDDFSSYSS